MSDEDDTKRVVTTVTTDLDTTYTWRFEGRPVDTAVTNACNQIALHMNKLTRVQYIDAMLQLIVILESKVACEQRAMEHKLL